MVRFHRQAMGSFLWCQIRWRIDLLFISLLCQKHLFQSQLTNGELATNNKRLPLRDAELIN